MKQYTTQEQTAKLIALGLPKPTALVDKYYDFDAEAYTEIKAYSIGGLIGMLPTTIPHKIWFGEDKGKEGVWGLRIDTGCTGYGWDISYERPYSAPLYLESRSELVDALFDMIVKFKEEKQI